ncbi:hypothetical protein BC937DRAFT_94465 [Endogone sp. FLAS-F59071]|nr:hypothetical protein BC937DRAFT_94465 [Endogone sp. FLAS-F59071]|eukprot:RUS20752.1 hypothetical protein BC937DRAFT_94465 [Endogone sp. FLAS-F59071]
MQEERISASEPFSTIMHRTLLIRRAPLYSSSRWSFPITPDSPVSSTVVLEAIDEQVPSRTDHKFLKQPAVSLTLDVGEGGSVHADVTKEYEELATVSERVIGNVKTGAAITIVQKTDPNSQINTFNLKSGIASHQIDPELHLVTTRPDSCTISPAASIFNFSRLESDPSPLDNAPEWATGVLRGTRLESSSLDDGTSALEQVAVAKARARDLVTLLFSIEPCALPNDGFLDRWGLSDADMQAREKVEARLRRKLDVEREQIGLREGVKGAMFETMSHSGGISYTKALYHLLLALDLFHTTHHILYTN